jgi:hypothetical protein
MKSSAVIVGGMGAGEAVTTGAHALANAKMRQTSPAGRRYDLITFIGLLLS